MNILEILSCVYGVCTIDKFQRIGLPATLLVQLGCVKNKSCVFKLCFHVFQRLLSLF